MPREKIDYREHLALMYAKIDEKFPDNMGFLTAEQVADILACNVNTVYARATRHRDPLPSKNIGTSRRKILRFPVAGLVRWTLG